MVAMSIIPVAFSNLVHILTRLRDGRLRDGRLRDERLRDGRLSRSQSESLAKL